MNDTREAFTGVGQRKRRATAAASIADKPVRAQRSEFLTLQIGRLWVAVRHKQGGEFVRAEKRRFHVIRTMGSGFQGFRQMPDILRIAATLRLIRVKVS
jgi:hypothetical protein